LGPEGQKRPSEDIPAAVPTIATNRHKAIKHRGLHKAGEAGFCILHFAFGKNVRGGRPYNNIYYNI
jgi:hypothetical protein